MSCTSVALLACILGLADPGMAQGLQRTEEGLIVRYDFRTASGRQIPIVSVPGEPTGFDSAQHPERESDVVRIPDQFTVEAWVEPAPSLDSKEGTIIAMASVDGWQKLELGQVGGRFEARFGRNRTSGRDVLPISARDGDAASFLAHVVFTRDPLGRSRMYLDGEIGAERSSAGPVREWNETTVTLGRGPHGTRAWTGVVHLVAIYGRALLPVEVAGNFLAGPGLPARGPTSVPENLALFRSRIAPLLASRCLDCHDSAIRQGGLDLSRRESALAGGDHGDAIVPGDAEASLVWRMTESEAMPQNRPPLTPAEMRSVREWIAGGAHWPIEAPDTVARDAAPTEVAKGSVVAKEGEDAP